MALSDKIRAAISDTGLTVYQISKETGISQPVISRFLRKERAVSLSTADKLAEYLGLELVAKRSAKK